MTIFSRLGAGLCAGLLCFLASACSAVPSGSSGSAASSGSGASSSSALDSCRLSDAEDFYDLSSLLYLDESFTPCTEDDATWHCGTWGLADSDTLVLVYQNTETASLCRACRFSLGSGTLSVFTDPWQSGTDEGGTNRLSLLSASPLIVSDDSGDTVVFADQADGPVKVALSDELRYASLQVSGGKLYAWTSVGMLWEIGTDGSASAVWSLPDGYTWSYLETEPYDDRITVVCTVSGTEDVVRLDYFPADGTMHAYTQEQDSAFPDAAWDGVDLFVTYDTADAALPAAYTACSETGGYQVTCEVPDSIADQIAASEEGRSAELITALQPAAVAGSEAVFALSGSDSFPVSLYLWDFSGGPFTDYAVPAETPYRPVSVDYGDLTDRAEALSATYGVTVRIGENVKGTYTDYTCEPFLDSAEISAALDTVEDALSLYPDGFFEQLYGSSFRSVVLELAGTLSPTDASTGVSDAAAVTCFQDGVCYVVLNLDSGLLRGTVVHEISHVIDQKISDAGLADEEAWNALNPEGFSYYSGYVDENGTGYEASGDLRYTSYAREAMDGDYSEVYFYDAYAKTYATEDRARIMECLLGYDDWIDPCFSGQHLQEKASYYFQLIRTAFDTEGWPEQTSWEAALASVAPQGSP